jgi:ADP-ribosylglycohydrolase
MIGAYVGDVVGSEYEFPPGIHRDPAVPLFTPKAAFTDDSVCTSAIAQWLLSGEADPTPFLHQMGRLHIDRGFGGAFSQWLRSNDPQPYGSWGNGSAMRVSSCALWALNDEQARQLARDSATPTHGDPTAIAGAQAITLAIRWAMEGFSLPDIIARVEREFGYSGITDMDPALLRKTHKFDVSCKGTVPLALACLHKGESFEGAMRLCVSMGGDADTLAAIAGPVGEALWGVPEYFFASAASRTNFGDLVLEPILAVYGHPRVRSRINGGGVGSPLRWA